MQEFLHSILSFPTSMFPGVLGLVVLYWLTVLLGVLDLDVLDFDLDVDAGADGGFDGADSGDLDADAEQPGGLAGLIHALGLAGVPLTISGSVMALVAWMVSNLLMRGVEMLLPKAVGSFLVGIPVAVVALAGGVFVASRAVKPLRPLFATQHAALRAHFVGKICTVTTLKVTDRYGQAEIEDGGAGQLVQVRCLEDHGLSRGDTALIFDYDADEEVYHVAPAGAALSS